MQDVFITKLHIDKVRHLQGIDIALSDTDRKHLILTGKNGSGKTSLLEAMRNIVIRKQGVDYLKLDQKTQEKYTVKGILQSPKVSISYSRRDFDFKDVVFAYIAAERSELAVPKAIELADIEEKTIITRNASKDFMKYMLSLDYRLYGAKTENNAKLVGNLEKWFSDFLDALREVYSCSELDLRRDTKNLKFEIVMPGREPFGLNEMADGYAAFLDIYMELLMRFEGADATVEYGQSAIVMIDDIETHLNIELQQRVLPFLTKVFPNVQFIVSTNSPFIISSLVDAIVFILDKRERLVDPNFYAYETTIESLLKQNHR